jgi:hypothetical protein
MKQITKKTILKQEDKTFQPIEVDGVIYWVDINQIVSESHDVKDNFIYVEKYHHYCKVVAQSSNKIEGVPIIDLESYIQFQANKKFTRLCDADKRFVFRVERKSNPNQYTQKDIERAIELARNQSYGGFNFSKQQILEQINSISIIEVNENWEVISYE